MVSEKDHRRESRSSGKALSEMPWPWNEVLSQPPVGSGWDAYFQDTSDGTDRLQEQIEAFLKSDDRAGEAMFLPNLGADYLPLLSNVAVCIKAETGTPSFYITALATLDRPARHTLLVPFVYRRPPENGVYEFVLVRDRNEHSPAHSVFETKCVTLPFIWVPSNFRACLQPNALLAEVVGRGESYQRPDERQASGLLNRISHNINHSLRHISSSK